MIMKQLDASWAGKVIAQTENDRETLEAFCIVVETKSPELAARARDLGVKFDDASLPGLLNSLAVMLYRCAPEGTHFTWEPQTKQWTFTTALRDESCESSPS